MIRPIRPGGKPKGVWTLAPLLEPDLIKMLHKQESTARLTSQEETPTATKNTAAQASEPEVMPLMIAIEMIVAAIEHAKAIARPHQ